MKVTQSTQFKKDAKRQGKRDKDLDKLFDVIDLLISAKDLRGKPIKPCRFFDAIHRKTHRVLTDRAA
jgi:hypothetical protein